MVILDSNHKDKSDLKIDCENDKMEIETMTSPKYIKKNKNLKEKANDNIEKLSYIKLMEHIINTHPRNEQD